MKVIIAQSNLTLRGGAERIVLKVAQHYDAKIYTAEYDASGTYEGFKDLDISVVKKGFVSSMLPYGRVSQGLHYGLSFYGLKIKEDYDVINAHIAPSHWIRNRNERVLLVRPHASEGPVRSLPVPAFAEEELPEADSYRRHERGKGAGPVGREKDRGDSR